MRENILTPQLPPVDHGYPWKNIKPWQTGLVTGLAVLVGIISILSGHFTGKEWILYIVLAVYGFLFVLSLIKPRIGFYTSIILMGVEHVTLFPTVGVKTVLFFTVPATFVYLMVYPGWWLNKYAKIIPERKRMALDFPLIILVILGGFSIFWSYSRLYAFYWWLMIVFNYALYYLTGALVTDTKILKRVIGYTIFSAFMIAVGCVVTFLWQIAWDKMYHWGHWNLELAFKIIYRRAGGFAGSNHAAFTINLAMGYVLVYFYRCKRRISKILNASLVLFFLYGIVLTQSRTGTACSLFIICMMIYYMTRWKKDFYRKIFFAILLVIFVMIMGDLSNMRGKSFFSRYGSVVSDNQSNITGIGIRIKWWKQGWAFQLKHDNLLWGMGLGGLMWNVNLGPDINSIYLCYPFELGMVGVLLFCGTAWVFYSMLTPVIRYSMKHRSFAGDMFLGSFASFCGTSLIQGMVEYDFYGRIIWFSIAILMVTWRFAKEKMDNPEPEQIPATALIPST